MLRVSVVMPVYNELWTIREIFRRVVASPVVDELVIVDDASTDGTRAVIEELVAAHDGKVAIRFLKQPANAGKGAALRLGFAEATGDIILVQDADLEYDPADYPKLIEPIVSGQADVVYGSRFVGHPRRVLKFWHSVANRLLTMASNMATDLNLTDMETCYKVFKAPIIKSIPIRSDRFGFEPEVTAKIGHMGCRVYEVPVAYHGRTAQEGKKIGLKDAFQALWVIFKYWLIDDLGPMDLASYTLRMMQRAMPYNGWLFEKFRGHVRGRVLEIGSGLGNITRFLVHCTEVVATDVEPRFLRELRTAYGGYGNVMVRWLDARTPVEGIGRFDTIVALNVLEHVEDHVAAFGNLFRLLRPGGRAIVLVPAMPDLYCDLDRNLGHRRRYTRQSLAETLRACGFEVLDNRYLNKLGAIGWLVNGRLLGRQVLPSRQVRTFSRMVPMLDRIDRIPFFPFPFGLSVLAVAERPRTSAAD